MPLFVIERNFAEELDPELVNYSEVRLVNAGSVGMPYADEPGAYWALLDGTDLELRHTRCQAPDVSEWPGEWPQASADEATEFFEKLSREQS